MPKVMDNTRKIQVDEALKSPFSRVYLCPETEQIINCAMGLRDPIELQSLKKAFSNPIILKHPRFCSLMVRDRKGVEHWKKTHVNIDDHIIIHHHHHPPAAMEGGEEGAVNDFLADVAVSTPLSVEKPLWEVHVLMGLNCVVLRVHHSLGDGASLMSMLSACFGKKKDNVEGVTIINSNSNSNNDNKNGDRNVKTCTKKNNERKKGGGVWSFVKCLWFTLVFGFRLLGRLLWVKDDKSVIYGGDGVELWPRKLITAKFMLEDFKSIKKTIPNATVNDVLLGLISSGISKYLDIKSPKAMNQGVQVSGIVVVNLRKGPGLQDMSDLMKTGSGSKSGSWGNKTGLVVQPVHCHKGVHPLEHVTVMKSIMDQKKNSYEAYIPYLTLQLFTSCLGPKAACWLVNKMLYNTTFLVSNIMGPSNEMAIADNPVTYVRVNISSMPQAMTLHMVSYAGKADLQVMVAKDIITDSQLLVKCFEEALLEMKNSNKDELVGKFVAP